MGYAQIQVATAVAAGRRWMENGSDLVAPTRPQMRVLLDTLDAQARELDRLRKIEAGRVALFARLEVRDRMDWLDQDMTTDELRGFFGGSS